MTTFSFIDSVSDVRKNESLTAFFTLKGHEEFLGDHFAGFPVMPGVLLIESLKQAAVRLLRESDAVGEKNFRLVRVAEAKFGKFVKPGQSIRLFVRMVGAQASTGPGLVFDGRIDLVQGEHLMGRALAATFSLEPV